MYRSAHVGVSRRRRAWFDRLERRSVAPWWVPVGQIPTIDEAKARLGHLELNGPTHIAFTIRERFAAPGDPASRASGRADP